MQGLFAHDQLTALLYTTELHLLLKLTRGQPFRDKGACPGNTCPFPS